MTKCTWCDNTAITEVELEPPRRGKDKRTGLAVIKKPPIMAPACKDHKDILNEQPPFYTCGCSYVEGELRCPRHNNLLKQPHRERLTKDVIKDANQVS